MLIANHQFLRIKFMCCYFLDNIIKTYIIFVHKVFDEVFVYNISELDLVHHNVFVVLCNKENNSMMI